MESKRSTWVILHVPNGKYVFIDLIVMQIISVTPLPIFITESRNTDPQLSEMYGVPACHWLIATREIQHRSRVLEKGEGKLDCLIYEMLLILEKHPKLSSQTDSIQVKVFTLNTYRVLNHESRTDVNSNT